MSLPEINMGTHKHDSTLQSKNTNRLLLGPLKERRLQTSKTLYSMLPQIIWQDQSSSQSIEYTGEKELRFSLTQSVCSSSR